MAVATIDGNQVNLPDFAMDNTIKELSRKMDGYAKSNEALLKKIMSGKGTAGDADKGSKKIDEAVKRQVRAIESSRTAMGPFEKALTGAANAVGMMTASFITGISAFTGILTGLAIESFMKFGSALNELTTVGLNQSMEEMGHLTGDVMALGMTFNEATDFIKDNSMAFQEMGQGATDFALAFMNATDSGVALGLALDDTIGILSEELAIRARLGNMDEANSQKVAESIADMTKTQLEYTQALGMSIDAIRMFASSLVQDSAPLAAALMSMSEELRQNTITQVQKFASVLAATGGQVGQNLADAATEAAAFGAIGFSASAREFITVLPQLAGPFQNVIDGFRNGVMDGEEAALQFTNTLGNLNDVEKERIFAIARTGNQQALAMSKSILLFEQSARKLSALAKEGQKYEPEDIQKAYNMLGSIPRTLLSTIDGIKNNFMIRFMDLLNTEKGMNGFINAVNRLKESLVTLAKTFMDGPFTGGGNPLEKLAEFFENIINNIRDRITTFDARMNKYFSKEEGGTIGTFFTEFIEEPFHALLRTVLMNIEKMVKTIGPNFVAVGEDLAFGLINALKDVEVFGIKAFSVDEGSNFHEKNYEKHSAKRDAEHQEKLKNLDDELLLKYFKEDPNNTFFQKGRTSAVYDALQKAGEKDEVLIDSSGMVQTPANSLIKGASGGFYNLYEGGNVSIDSINDLITARRQGGDAIQTLLANIADPDQRARASRKIDDVMGGQDLTSFADKDGNKFADGEELIKALNTLIRVSKDQTRVIQDGQ